MSADRRLPVDVTSVRCYDCGYTLLYRYARPCEICRLRAERDKLRGLLIHASSRISEAITERCEEYHSHDGRCDPFDDQLVRDITAALLGGTDER